MRDANVSMKVVNRGRSVADGWLPLGPAPVPQDHRSVTRCAIHNRRQLSYILLRTSCRLKAKPAAVYH